MCQWRRASLIARTALTTWEVTIGCRPPPLNIIFPAGVAAVMASSCGSPGRPQNGLGEWSRCVAIVPKITAAPITHSRVDCPLCMPDPLNAARPQAGSIRAPGSYGVAPLWRKSQRVARRREPHCRPSPKTASIAGACFCVRLSPYCSAGLIPRTKSW